MNLTPSQLITWSLVLLAIALLVAAGTLIVNEVIRAQRNRTIGRAILRGLPRCPRKHLPCRRRPKRWPGIASRTSIFPCTG